MTQEFANLVITTLGQGQGLVDGRIFDLAEDSVLEYYLDMIEDVCADVAIHGLHLGNYDDFKDLRDAAAQFGRCLGKVQGRYRE